MRAFGPWGMGWISGLGIIARVAVVTGTIAGPMAIRCLIGCRMMICDRRSVIGAWLVSAKRISGRLVGSLYNCL